MYIQHGVKWKALKWSKWFKQGISESISWCFGIPCFFNLSGYNLEYWIAVLKRNSEGTSKTVDGILGPSTGNHFN